MDTVHDRDVQVVRGGVRGVRVIVDERVVQQVGRDCDRRRVGHETQEPDVGQSLRYGARRGSSLPGRRS